MPEKKFCPWTAMGKLRKGAPARMFELGSLLISVNWASDWTWAIVDAKGDLQHHLIGITKTERLTDRHKVLSIYTFYCLKLIVVVGRAAR